ncbi:MAG TPA: ABC transporter permease, partial [Anaerolineae bacterium]|nr:ABC transporter permease [Anaerolineae bacterium]
MKAERTPWLDGFTNIWIIAVKDIRDAFKSRLILSLILVLGFMVATPSLISVFLVQPDSPIAVYDTEGSELLQALEDDPGFTVRKAISQDNLLFLVGSSSVGPGVEAGLLIPAGFDAGMVSGTPPGIQLYVSWANRGELQNLEVRLADLASELLGLDEPLSIESQIVYPSTGGFQMLGFLGMTSVLIITMIGLYLVPHLLLEEKHTKTLDALLVAPATIRQVVAGKTLAGMFYMFISAVIVFLGSWSAIVHWEVAALFVLAAGLISTAMGLVIGTFFDRGQDALGLMIVFIFLLYGALIVDMVGLEIPGFLQPLIAWIPTTSLTRMLWFCYAETVDWGHMGQLVG